MEKQPQWPDGGVGFVVVTGTVVERTDVPVFKLDPELPFGAGLPVPQGYDAEDIRRRYVIGDVQWELVEKPSEHGQSKEVKQGDD